MTVAVSVLFFVIASMALIEALTGNKSSLKKAVLLIFSAFNVCMGALNVAGTPAREIHVVIGGLLCIYGVGNIIVFFIMMEDAVEKKSALFRAFVAFLMMLWTITFSVLQFVFVV